MPAVFNATASFSIPSRKAFVIAGDIASGVAKKGMMMKLRMNSSFAIELPIDSIEFIRKKEGSEVGLLTVCRDADELALLQGLNIGKETIEIDDAPPDEHRG